MAKIDNYDWLYHQYITLDKTAAQIGKEQGVSGRLISRRCRFLKIPSKTAKEKATNRGIRYLKGFRVSEELAEKLNIQPGEAMLGNRTINTTCAYCGNKITKVYRENQKIPTNMFCNANHHREFQKRQRLQRIK